MKNSLTILRKLHKSGSRNNDYATIRIPKILADKWSMGEPCKIKIIDCEDLGGILIKKA